MTCPFHPNCILFFSSGSISFYQTCLLLYFLGLILPRDTSCPFPGSALQHSIMGINTCHGYGCNQACHTHQENCQIGQFCCGFHPEKRVTGVENSTKFGDTIGCNISLIQQSASQDLSWQTLNISASAGCVKIFKKGSLRTVLLHL